MVTADPARRLDDVLRRARRRLRWRHAVAGAAVGGHVACWLALPVGVLAGGLGGPVPALAAAAACVAVGAGVGAAVGALRSPPGRRDTALALDRLGASHELLLNAVHAVDSPDDPNRDAILARLAGPLPEPAAFALRPARHLRAAPIPLLLAALGVALLPRLPDPRTWFASPDDPLAAVGEELRERLARDDAPEGVELPPALRKDAAALADDLAAGELSREEAERRLAELTDQLRAYDATLAGSRDAMKDLEDAAKELREQAPGLADDLADGDLGASADSARQLSEQLAAQGTPEERRAAGEALERAGRELKGSSDPSLQRAGDAMQQAGEAMQQGDGTLSPEQQQALGEELAKAKATGEQLAKDRAAMKAAQETAAAVEAARQRLGEEASVGTGEGQGEGQGEPGDGPGATPGPGDGTPGNQAGSGHTWEDQGEFGDEPGKQNTAASGPSAAEGHQQIDDFQKLYDELRLEGAKSLVTGTNSQLHEQGRVDVVQTRLTTAEEVARTGAVELPATYREAATEAVQSEDVPAAYRDVVKQYFDGME